MALSPRSPIQHLSPLPDMVQLLCTCNPHLSLLTYPQLWQSEEYVSVSYSLELLRLYDNDWAECSPLLPRESCSKEETMPDLFWNLL